MITNTFNVGNNSEEDDNRPTTDPNVDAQDLEDGELYVYRRGKLKRIPRDELEGDRKVRITEDAFEAALTIAKGVRSMLGWKPDVTLVISAILLNRTNDEERNQQAIREFLVTRLANTESTIA